MFRAERLVGYEDDELYMPGYSTDKEKRLASDEYRARMKFCDVPQLLVMSELNSVYDSPNTLKIMHELLQEIHPEHADWFEFELLEGYGHLDIFLGKNAAKDVFPRIVSFLDKYQSTNLPTVQVMEQACLINSRTGGQEFNEIKLDQNVPEEVNYLHFKNSVVDPDVIYLEMTDKVQLMEHQKIASIELKNAFPLRKTVIWKKKASSYKQVNQAKYAPLTTSSLDVVPVEYTDLLKRDIYAISDTHMGAYFGMGAPARLNVLLEKLMAASFEVHSFVMVGDIFEMTQFPINEAPPTDDKLAQQLKSGKFPGVLEVLAGIRALAEEHNVNVYYIRGNHDYQMTADACKALFGDKVKFVTGALLLEIREGNEIYQCRFEHGHDHDVFNSYVLADEADGLLPGGQNFGHFVCRMQATSHFEGNGVYNIIQKRLPGIIKTLGHDTFGSLLVKLLSTDKIQRWVSKQLLEGTFEGKIHPDQKILINEAGEYITYNRLLNYNFFKKLTDKYGPGHVLLMLKHSMEDHSDFVATCTEDVVIVGHSEIKACAMMPGRHGDVIYGNCGAWHDDVEESSYIKITPPRHDVIEGQGRVELNYMPHNRVTFHKE